MKCAPRELAIARSRSSSSRPSISTRASCRRPRPTSPRPSPTRRPPSRTSPARPLHLARVRRGRGPSRRRDTDGDGIPDSRDQCITRARGQGRLPRRRRLPRPGQRRRRHPRHASTSAPTSPRTSTASRTRTAAPTRTTTATASPTSTTSARTRPASPAATSPGCPKKNSLIVVTEQGDPHHPADPVRVQQGRHPPGHQLQDPRRGRRRAERQPEDQPRGAGPHRQRRRRRLQHEAVADARRRGAGLPRRARHRARRASSPRATGSTSPSCPTPPRRTARSTGASSSFAPRRAARSRPLLPAIEVPAGAQICQGSTEDLLTRFKGLDFARALAARFPRARTRLQGRLLLDWA